MTTTGLWILTYIFLSGIFANGILFAWLLLCLFDGIKANINR